MRREDADAKMGIKAVDRKPRLSKSPPDHKKYPYFLRG